MQRQLKLGRICGVAAAATAAEMTRQLREALGLVDTVELRLDWLRGAAEREKFIGWLKRRRFDAQLIATCRRREAGGLFPGTVRAQRRILEEAVGAGCRWYDIEIESVEVSARGLDPVAILEHDRNHSARAIVSLHRFHRGAHDPATLLRRLRRAAPGQLCKLAVHCRGLRDSARLLRLGRRQPLIAVPMGPAALAARVLSLREGSMMTYAAVSNRTAPGQPNLEEMERLFRADRIDHRTRVYGIIGNQVAKSVSPAMHNAAIRAAGINAVYLPFLVEDLADFMAAIAPFGIRGFSVTIPHKRSIAPRLDGCDTLAKRLGAVNTVVVRKGRLYGYNTDYQGVLGALEGHVRLAGSRVLLVGAGGAARAAAFAMADSGARVFVLARRPAQARALARAVGGSAIERKQVRRQSFDAIINATPVGMEPDRRSPLTAAELNAPVVFDMVYRPLETPLLRLGAGRGLQTISGIEMLVAQGAAQWELWMGSRAPLRLMRRAVSEALRRAESAH